MSEPGTGTRRPQRNWRQWRIPAKINGRVRTSTLAFGIFFVLTGLWYGQVSAEIAERDGEQIQGPTAPDPADLTPYTEPQSETGVSGTSTATSTPAATTETEQPSGVVDDTGQQPTSTAAPITTTTFGLPLPPGIQSLIPTQPAPTPSR
ncbi:hypothetical protein [Rhodococcoides navarretei]|uniref:Uncharacterized protein n=1 Tax=Rhodococcus navarretei TaxID=3128981 RepID=A0ABU9CZA3_9NOCA